MSYATIGNTENCNNYNDTKDNCNDNKNKYSNKKYMHNTTPRVK